MTGQLPYSAKSPRELFHQLLTKPPLTLTEARRDLAFPRGLEEVVARGLQREPAKRQATVVAFADEFAAAAAQPPAGARSGWLGPFKGMFGTGR